MSDRTFQILLTFSVAIFAAIISPIFANAINKLSNKRKKENNEEKLNYKKIEIEINDRYEQNHFSNKGTSRNNESSNDDFWVLIIFTLTIGLGLVYLYLKYKVVIHFAIQLLIVFIASFICMTSYHLFKNKIDFDSNFKWRYASLIGGLVVAQLNLYLLDNPIYYKTVDKGTVFKDMQEQGVFSIISNHSSEIFGFLIYQVAGIVLTLFIFTVVIAGIINILALVNIAISEKENKIWNWIFKVTFRFVGKPLSYFIFTMFVSIISLGFTSGTLIQLIENMNKI